MGLVYIYAYMNGRFLMVFHEGKYSSPMDDMGEDVAGWLQTSGKRPSEGLVFSKKFPNYDPTVHGPLNLGI